MKGMKEDIKMNNTVELHVVRSLPKNWYNSSHSPSQGRGLWCFLGIPVWSFFLSANKPVRQQQNHTTQVFLGHREKTLTVRQADFVHWKGLFVSNPERKHISEYSGTLFLRHPSRRLQLKYYFLFHREGTLSFPLATKFVAAGFVVVFLLTADKCVNQHKIFLLHREKTLPFLPATLDSASSFSHPALSSLSSC